jgi:hypothetical protein
VKSAEKLRSQVRGTVPERKASPGQRERDGTDGITGRCRIAHMITLRTAAADSDRFVGISRPNGHWKMGKKVQIGQLAG